MMVIMVKGRREIYLCTYCYLVADVPYLGLLSGAYPSGGPVQLGINHCGFDHHSVRSPWREPRA